MLDAIFNIKNRHGKSFLFFCFFVFFVLIVFYTYSSVGSRDGLLGQVFFSWISLSNIYAFVFDKSYHFVGTFYPFEKSIGRIAMAVFYILIFLAAQSLPVLL